MQELRLRPSISSLEAVLGFWQSFKGDSEGDSNINPLTIRESQMKNIAKIIAILVFIREVIDLILMFLSSVEKLEVAMAEVA